MALTKCPHDTNIEAWHGCGYCEEERLKVARQEGYRKGVLRSLNDVEREFRRVAKANRASDPVGGAIYFSEAEVAMVLARLRRGVK